MQRRPRRFTTLVFCLFAPFWARAGSPKDNVSGTITDSSGAAVPNARLGLFSRVGLLAETGTGKSGAFSFHAISGDATKLVITADGFATATVALPAQSPLHVQLDIAPQSDSIRVAGSTIDLTAGEQAGSVSVIDSAEIRERNEAQATGLLRELPGLAIVQTGQNGGATSLFLRGGDSNYALVTIDGMPVNSFDYGGGFDFSQMPTGILDHIEVVRGAQSALYGSYANSGVVNFVTRSAAEGPTLDVIAEGGSHDENRFAVSGSGTVAGFGVAASASRIFDNNEVPNSDWRDENILLHINRNWDRQSFTAAGTFNSNAEGVPGPYGSDPLGLYPGLDLITRDKNNNSEYMFHYQDDIGAKVRGELFGGFFLGNNFYISPYGNSFNKDIRGQAEARVVGSISKNWTMSAGFMWAREEVENTYITDNSFNVFPLRRDEEGIYWENRLQLRKLTLQLGVRGELFHTLAIPAYMDPYTDRPEDPAHGDSRVNPKLAAAYMLTAGLRVHASAGAGIRPPGANDLAFTNNPDLKPERNTSLDAGIAQSFLGGRIVLDGTFFYNRYADLIVSLGGSLSELSAYVTDNLANAKTQGVETSAQLRPVRWMALSANYTYVDSQVLALNHTGAAQDYYRVGQQLPRRPPQSGSFRLALTKGRFTGDLVGYIRGDTLDVEPNYGASAGFFNNPGYAYLSLNLDIAAGRGMVVYGSLRNALDEHYEEVFGFPSPRLNFVTGVKWSLHGKDYGNDF
jgi:outer membrane cobalamin receptor